MGWDYHGPWCYMYYGSSGINVGQYCLILLCISIGTLICTLVRALVEALVEAVISVSVEAFLYISPTLVLVNVDC